MTDLVPEIILIAHNLRSCHNVGSLLRTAEGLGVAEVILSGYTPYPMYPENSISHDPRLPHEARKLHKQIQKTALGAEFSQPWRHIDPATYTIYDIIAALKGRGFHMAAVEQSNTSVKINLFTSPAKIALLVGREVEGVEPEVLRHMDTTLEIPMFGSKESFNVVQAAAMALYHCRFIRP